MKFKEFNEALTSSLDDAHKVLRGLKRPSTVETLKDKSLLQTTVHKLDADAKAHHAEINANLYKHGYREIGKFNDRVDGTSKTGPVKSINNRFQNAEGAHVHVQTLSNGSNHKFAEDHFVTHVTHTGPTSLVKTVKKKVS